MIIRSLVLAGILTVTVPLGHSALPASDDIHTPVVVFVSILPQAYFVDRIGGPHVDTRVLIPPGQSPHAYEPTPRQMVGLAAATVYFRIGLPFEDQLLPRIEDLAPALKIVDVGRGIPRRAMNGDHQAGTYEESGAARGLADPHLWLDPRLAKVQARHTCDGLSKVDPAHSPDYEANLDSLVADLDRLDTEIAETLASVSVRGFYVFHPAFGYFADAYGLEQIPVEIDGKEPGARDLAALIQRAREDGVKIILVQPQFSPRTAEAVAREIGGAVVPVDPLAYDYVANLRSIAESVRRALSNDGG